MTGLIVSTILWGDVLKNVFDEEIRGVDCVLSTATQSFTYSITNGIATYVGKGDSHDSEFSDEGRSIILTGEGLFSDTSASYTLTVYPTAEFLEVYSTVRACES